MTESNMIKLISFFQEEFQYIRSVAIEAIEQSTAAELEIHMIEAGLI